MSLMKWKKYIALSAFFLLIFLLSLYLTFPWNAVKDRIAAQASIATKMTVSIGSLSPHWLSGVKARSVEVKGETFAEALKLEQITVTARPLKLLGGAQAASVFLPLGGGEIDFDIALSKGEAEYEANIDDVELGKVAALATLSGLKMTGRISADFVLDANADPKKTDGSLNLTVSELELHEGSTLKGFPLPIKTVNLGSFNWEVPIEAGVANLNKLSLDKGDIAAELNGTVKLGNKPATSRLNVMLKFKPSTAFLQREKTIGGALGFISSAKGAGGYYGYQLLGTVKRPRFVPKKP